MSSSKQGLTTKQVEDLIVKRVESDTITLTYTDLSTSGDSNRVTRKVHVNTTSKDF
ncbi:MAG TPA: hypothetical protein VLA48_10510 [Nitrososphaeraceae archaeon]|nr:hypothetical protein [Nitrososphaeraceae archaeon]